VDNRCKRIWAIWDFWAKRIPVTLGFMRVVGVLGFFVPSTKVQWHSENKGFFGKVGREFFRPTFL